MTSNGQRYKMVATLATDNERFKRLCRKAAVQEVDGFRFALEAWEHVLD